MLRYQNQKCKECKEHFIIRGDTLVRNLTLHRNWSYCRTTPPSAVQSGNWRRKTLYRMFRWNRAISGPTRLVAVLFPRNIRQDGRCLTKREACPNIIYMHLSSSWTESDSCRCHPTVKDILWAFSRESLLKMSDKSLFIKTLLAWAVG